MEIFGIPSQAFFGQLLLGLINGSFYAVLSLGLAIIFGLLGNALLSALNLRDRLRTRRRSAKQVRDSMP